MKFPVREVDQPLTVQETIASKGSIRGSSEVYESTHR